MGALLVSSNKREIGNLARFEEYIEEVLNELA